MAIQQVHPLLQRQGRPWRRRQRVGAKGRFMGLAGTASELELVTLW